MAEALAEQAATTTLPSTTMSTTTRPRWCALAGAVRDAEAEAAEAVAAWADAGAAANFAGVDYRLAATAYDEAKAAEDAAFDAYYAGVEDAQEGRRFDSRGHPDGPYRAGWDAYHDAQSSGDPFAYIVWEPSVVAPHRAAADAAFDNMTDAVTALGQAVLTHEAADAQVALANTALEVASEALWASAPEGTGWPDVEQACES